MYEAFYGLRERPFSLTPDPKYLYLSEMHKEAFAHLLYGIKNRSGFVMLTGEIGTGKTTICRNLLNQIEEDTEVAFIFNPPLNTKELMEKINREFGIASQARHTTGLVDELNAYLLEAARQGKSCVLVIDESQNLTPQVLEQIRMLSNLETEKEKLLQIILIGQPELAEMLQLHELRQLNQRITARYHLKALSQQETLQYIAYRLHVAGAKRRVNFDKAAVTAVYRHSRGTPRVINSLCDRALLIGYTRELHTITRQVIRQAAHEIKGERISAGKPRSIGWRQWLPSPAIVMAILALIGLATFFGPPLDRLTAELRQFNALLGGGAAPENAAWPAPAPPAAIPEAHADETTNETAAAENPPANAPGPVARAILERIAPNPLDGAAALPNFTEELAAVSAEAARHAAASGILKAWGIDANGGPAADGVRDIRAYLDAHGLAQEVVRAGSAELLAINLPAFVRLESGGRATWAGLVGSQDDALRLTTPLFGETLVSLEEFDALFQREAIVPWRDPNPDAAVLRPNMRGDAVAELKDNLYRAGRLPKPSDNRYSRETEAAVRALQDETGLHVDGLAGRQVRMVLSSWLAEEDAAPALARRPQPLPDDSAALGIAGALEEAPAQAAPSPAALPENPPPPAVAEAPAAPAPEPRPAAPPAPEPEPIAPPEQTAPIVAVELAPPEQAAPASTESNVPAETQVAAETSALGGEVSEAPQRRRFWLGPTRSAAAAAQSADPQSATEEAGDTAAYSGEEGPADTGQSRQTLPMDSLGSGADRGRRVTEPAYIGAPLVPRHREE